MYLIDTNVMLAASAFFDDDSALAEDAMPLEFENRELVFNWLKEFEDSNDFMILDEEGLIREEYDKKMKYNQSMMNQEYGQQVLLIKQSQNQIEYVSIEVDPLSISTGRIAKLSEELEEIVHDSDDRKWVAASLSAQDYLETNPPIVYGAESDWFYITERLKPFNIEFLKLLPDEWYQQ